MCVCVCVCVCVLSSTDRLFHCITTLSCGYTRWMLQAGIETVSMCPRLCMVNNHSSSPRRI